MGRNGEQIFVNRISCVEQGDREDGWELVDPKDVWKCTNKPFSIYRNVHIENKKNLILMLVLVFLNILNHWWDHFKKKNMPEYYISIKVSHKMTYQCSSPQTFQSIY